MYIGTHSSLFISFSSSAFPSRPSMFLQIFLIFISFSLPLHIRPSVSCTTLFDKTFKMLTYEINDTEQDQAKGPSLRNVSVSNFVSNYPCQIRAYTADFVVSCDLYFAIITTPFPETRNRIACYIIGVDWECL